MLVGLRSGLPTGRGDARKSPCQLQDVERGREEGLRMERYKGELGAVVAMGGAYAGGKWAGGENGC